MKISKVSIILVLMFITLANARAQQNIPAYKNTNLTIEERVADLISRMTVEDTCRKS